MNDIRLERRTRIKALRTCIDVLQSAVMQMGMDYVRGFHFLNHRVSTFWECDKSPLGMCVFTLNDRMMEEYCMYCKQPNERK